MSARKIAQELSEQPLPTAAQEYFKSVASQDISVASATQAVTQLKSTLTILSKAERRQHHKQLLALAEALSKILAKAHGQSSDPEASLSAAAAIVELYTAVDIPKLFPAAFTCIKSYRSADKSMDSEQKLVPLLLHLVEVYIQRRNTATARKFAPHMTKLVAAYLKVVPADQSNAELLGAIGAMAALLVSHQSPYVNPGEPASKTGDSSSILAKAISLFAHVATAPALDACLQRLPDDASVRNCLLLLLVKVAGQLPAFADPAFVSIILHYVLSTAGTCQASMLAAVPLLSGELRLTSTTTIAAFGKALGCGVTDSSIKAAEGCLLRALVSEDVHSAQLSLHLWLSAMHYWPPQLLQNQLLALLQLLASNHNFATLHAIELTHRLYAKLDSTDTPPSRDELVVLSFDASVRLAATIDVSSVHTTAIVRWLAAPLTNDLLASLEVADDPDEAFLCGACAILPLADWKVAFDAVGDMVHTCTAEVAPSLVRCLSRLAAQASLSDLPEILDAVHTALSQHATAAAASEAMLVLPACQSRDDCAAVIDKIGTIMELVTRIAQDAAHFGLLQRWVEVIVDFGHLARDANAVAQLLRIPLVPQAQLECHFNRQLWIQPEGGTSVWQQFASSVQQD